MVVVVVMRTSMAIAFAALFLAVSTSALACDDPHKGKNLTLAAGTAPRSDSGLVVHLEDVQVKAGQAAAFRVFVNHPQADATTPMTHASFVDELFIVPAQTSSSGRTQSHNFTLALPPSAVREGEPVSLTLVPIPDENGRAGKVNVTVKRARLASR